MRILIIEDEKRLAEALFAILAEQNYQSDVVYDGESGLEYACMSTYDVIILDVMLPGIDGFTIAKELRLRHISTPILMLTARTTIKDKVTGLNSGADDYMTKPFSSEELIARVNALTRRQGNLILNELTFKDLTLDLGTADLKTPSLSVHLSYKEFEVLKYLMSNTTVITPKETLITNIWGYDSNTDDNNVEAYISFLRKKLNFLHSNTTIKTYRKLGYRLEGEPAC